MTPERLDSLPAEPGHHHGDDPGASEGALPIAEPVPACAPSDPVLDGVGPEDVRLPQIKIRQPHTENAEGVPEGSLFLTTQLETHALGREVVLLTVRKERSLLLPYAGGEAVDAMIRRIEEETGVVVPADRQGAVCFSRDRILPVVQEGIEPLSKACVGCPMARWRTVSGRRVQTCAESYRLVFFDLQAQRPCVFYARGSGIRPTRELLTAFKVACRRLDRPAFAFKVALSTRRADSGDRTYFVPVFDPPEPIEDMTEVGFLAEIHRACAGPPAEEE